MLTSSYMEDLWWEVKDSEEDGESHDTLGKTSTKPLVFLPDGDRIFSSERSSFFFNIFRLVFVCIFMLPFGGSGILLISYSIMEGIYLQACVGLPFLGVGIMFLYFLVNSFSTHRLRVLHSIDSLVFDSTFLSQKWRIKSRVLSDSLYLRYHKWTSTSTDEDGNTSTSTHHAYNIHGHSDPEGDWKLDISRMMVNFEHPKNEAAEIAENIGVEFRKY